jgi:hypothetical protein
MAMNFDAIRGKVGQYETNAEASPVSAQLRAVMAKHGPEVFRDTALLNREIAASPLSGTLKAQLALVFSSSTLPDFVLNAKSDLNMVDVDNAIHSVVASTGLSYKVALALVADVFFACGLNFAIEYGPQLRDGALVYALHALMPSGMADAEIKTAERLVAAHKALVGKGTETKDEEAVQKAAGEAVSAIRKLCNAGVPQGFYLLGRCHLYGDCGTEPDVQKALELLKIAADHGVAAAAAALGDIYYEPSGLSAVNGPDKDAPPSPAAWLLRDYTLAHHYYTRPGAMAMGTDRQRALRDIYRQHAANRTTLVFSGVVLALMIAFLALFHRGIFSGASRLAVGVVFTALSGLAYLGGILHNVRKPYNGLRWIVPAQYFIWSLYAFVLVLA